ncbi:hypothetical protein B1B04_06760 [Lysinibacillus sp. KCTC 33748]|uniref:hypothetical protein n=1 Tax=unclassified Lysinibacillus TaxID=2636778 RepID=UPI0009A849DA|nr:MULTISPECIES: hypothetical protein [unclassified Lysinibacillus]OXS75415.1 hypothetical protein B1B04_06760 [Lysinibacillus sp. KCTC 33748]SKB52776.1 hypothetical protein SAMN06295926_103212 [Lysinibacillus sp. AC-3]
MEIVSSFGFISISIFYLYQIIFFIFFRKKEPKEASLKYYKFTCVINFLIFLATLPVVFLLGAMSSSLFPFLIISGLPLLFFIWSLRDLLILQKKEINRYID